MSWLDELIAQVGESGADAVPSEPQTDSVFSPSRDSQSASSLFADIFKPEGGDAGGDASPGPDYMGAARDSQRANVDLGLTANDTSGQVTLPDTKQPTTLMQGMLNKLALKKTSDGSLDYSDPKTIDTLMRLVLSGGSIVNSMLHSGSPQGYKSAAQLQADVKSPFSTWNPQQQASANAFFNTPMTTGANRARVYAADMPSPIVAGRGYADGGTIAPPPAWSGLGQQATPGVVAGAATTGTPQMIPQWGALGQVMAPPPNPAMPNSAPMETLNPGGMMPGSPRSFGHTGGPNGGPRFGRGNEDPRIRGSEFRSQQNAMGMPHAPQPALGAAPAPSFSTSPGGYVDPTYGAAPSSGSYSVTATGWTPNPGVPTNPGFSSAASFGPNGGYNLANGQSISADQAAQIHQGFSGINTAEQDYMQRYGMSMPANLYGAMPDSASMGSPEQIQQWVNSNAPQQSDINLWNSVNSGAHMRRGGSVPGGYARGGALGHINVATGGQDDVVPIRAAGGEYMMDADTVSALGDGNNAAGAKKLDEMRHNIRRHKRSAPPDKIPPKAKPIGSYMKGAR